MTAQLLRCSVSAVSRSWRGQQDGGQLHDQGRREWAQGLRRGAQHPGKGRTRLAGRFLPAFLPAFEHTTTTHIPSHTRLHTTTSTMRCRAEPPGVDRAGARLALQPQGHQVLRAAPGHACELRGTCMVGRQSMEREGEGVLPRRRAHAACMPASARSPSLPPACMRHGVDNWASLQVYVLAVRLQPPGIELSAATAHADSCTHGSCAHAPFPRPLTQMTIEKLKVKLSFHVGTNASSQVRAAADVRGDPQDMHALPLQARRRLCALKGQSGRCMQQWHSHTNLHALARTRAGPAAAGRRGQRGRALPGGPQEAGLLLAARRVSACCVHRVHPHSSPHTGGACLRLS